LHLSFDFHSKNAAILSWLAMLCQYRAWLANSLRLAAEKARSAGLHENDTIAPIAFPFALIVERCWPPAGDRAEPVSVREAALHESAELKRSAHLVSTGVICTSGRLSRATARIAHGEFLATSPKRNSRNSPEHEHICELCRTFFGLIRTTKIRPLKVAHHDNSRCWRNVGAGGLFSSTHPCDPVESAGRSSKEIGEMINGEHLHTDRAGQRHVEPACAR
jgi:hypothetical protein